MYIKYRINQDSKIADLTCIICKKVVGLKLNSSQELNCRYGRRLGTMRNQVRCLVAVDNQTKLDKIFPGIINYPSIEQLAINYSSDTDKVGIMIYTSEEIEDMDSLVNIITKGQPKNSLVSLKVKIQNNSDLIPSNTIGRYVINKDGANRIRCVTV